MTCLPHRFLLISILLSAMYLSAVAADRVPAELDLLSSPLESAQAFWKAFSDRSDIASAEVWTCCDGILTCKGTPKGYLYSVHDYTDFILRLEWRWPEGKQPGKGGVLLRMTGPDKIWPTSLEAQINAGDAGDFWGLGGYTFDGPADRKRTIEHPQFGRLTNLKKTIAVEKPAGQWNHYTITVRGETVSLEINGQRVNTAYGCPVQPGKICLTAEGNDIQFRNVRLIPLDR